MVFRSNMLVGKDCAEETHLELMSSNTLQKSPMMIMIQALESYYLMYVEKIVKLKAKGFLIPVITKVLFHIFLNILF
jgi:hypothetical protein